MRTFLRVLLAGVGLFGAGPIGLAAEPTTLKAKVDALAGPLIDSGAVLGLVVGVIDGDRREVLGYGKPSKATERPPDGKTIFEIGSVSKVFTGLLLADMAERQLVRLEDPVEKHLPESVKVPRRDERPITLLDLTTHTSGLPRLPGNLLSQIAKRPQNPYADYTPEQLYEFLAKHSLSRRPGERYAYSNLGVGLLGQALAHRAGCAYELLVAERIDKPLGMKDTRITLAADQQQRLAQGHNADGRAVANWDIPTLAGAGGLRSTADDMLRFVAANLRPEKTPLAAAIEASHRPRHEISKGKESIALGWMIRVPEEVYWHNGQTGGYHSFIGFRKQRGIGVVVLSNSGTGVIDALGLRLLKVLAGEPVEPLTPRKAIRPEPAVLDQYVGRYEMTPGVFLTIFREADQLVLDHAGFAQVALSAESPAKFFCRSSDMEVTFAKDDKGRVFKLVLRQNGIDLPAWRDGLAAEAVKRLRELFRGKPPPP